MNDNSLTDSEYYNKMILQDSSMKAKADLLIKSLSKVAEGSRNLQKNDSQSISDSLCDYYKTLLQVANSGNVKN